MPLSTPGYMLEYFSPTHLLPPTRRRDLSSPYPHRLAIRQPATVGKLNGAAGRGPSVCAPRAAMAAATRGCGGRREAGSCLACVVACLLPYLRRRRRPTCACHRPLLPPSAPPPPSPDARARRRLFPIRAAAASDARARRRRCPTHACIAAFTLPPICATAFLPPSATPLPANGRARCCLFRIYAVAPEDEKDEIARVGREDGDRGEGNLVPDSIVACSHGLKMVF